MKKLKKTEKNQSGSLGWRFVKNFIRMLFLMWIVCGISFFLTALSPIDPLKTNVGSVALGSMSREQVRKLETYWGVGVPAGKRFFSWFFGLLHGDLGISLLYRRKVIEVIAEKFLNSVWMLGSAWLFSGFFGMILGMAAGAERGKRADRKITAFCMFLSGTPSFFIAILLLMMFAVYIPIFPVGFSIPIGAAASEVTWKERMFHAVLPSLTLGLAGIPRIAMHTRTKMTEIMKSDYILYARANGESRRRILLHHGLRNILFPVITLQFSSVSEIFGGSVLVEQVFSYPGLGQAAVAAGLGNDVPLLLGITLFSSGIVFLGNFAADLLCEWTDPRIRRGK